MSKLTKKVTFRFSENEYSKLLDHARNSGYNISEYFRNIILKNKTTVVAKEDSIKIIYHLNKTGNNINQIAHGINRAFLNGKVSEDLFVKYLRELNFIRQQQRNIVELVLYANNDK